MSPAANLRDGRRGKRLEAYTRWWQKDLNKEADLDNQNRLDSYADVVNGKLGHPNTSVFVSINHA